MKYLEIFKNIALKTPIIRKVISERNRLRGQAVGRLIGGGLGNRNFAGSFGYCHCCRQEAYFKINGDWLRDNYVCTNCFSIPRQRHIQYILDNYFKGWENSGVHESSPSNDLISRYCSDYSSSQYFDDINPGHLNNGVRCENLESLTFPDESFDIFITQDVFEHIFHPDRAAAEIMRVLKPGGAHVFTAPKYSSLNNSHPRAKIVDSKIEYLMEAAYHGSPIGDGKALVTWDYGKDFEKLINNWSKAFTTTYVTRDRSLGLDGSILKFS